MNPDIACDVIVSLVRERDIEGVKSMIANPVIAENLPWLKRAVAYSETGNRNEIEMLDPLVRPIAEDVAAVLKGEPK